MESFGVGGKTWEISLSNNEKIYAMGSFYDNKKVKTLHLYDLDYDDAFEIRQNSIGIIGLNESRVVVSFDFSVNEVIIDSNYSVDVIIFIHSYFICDKHSEIETANVKSIDISCQDLSGWSGSIECSVDNKDGGVLIRYKKERSVDADFYCDTHKCRICIYKMIKISDVGDVHVRVVSSIKVYFKDTTNIKTAASVLGAIYRMMAFVIGDLPLFGHAYMETGEGNSIVYMHNFYSDEEKLITPFKAIYYTKREEIEKVLSNLIKIDNEIRSIMLDIVGARDNYTYEDEFLRAMRSIDAITNNNIPGICEKLGKPFRVRFKMMTDKVIGKQLFCINVPIFGGNADVERKNVYEKVDRAVDIRNKIAHSYDGKIEMWTDMELRNLTNLFKELARDYIMICVGAKTNPSGKIVSQL